jgi:hypothetical protein
MVTPVKAPAAKADAGVKVKTETTAPPLMYKAWMLPEAGTPGVFSKPVTVKGVNVPAPAMLFSITPPLA